MSGRAYEDTYRITSTDMSNHTAFPLVHHGEDRSVPAMGVWLCLDIGPRGDADST